MPLTTAQNTALKNDIADNTNTINGVAINALPMTDDANFAIAGWYNQTASPSFTVWRVSVPLKEIAAALNGTELAGLTTANHTRLQTVITLISAASGANPSDADVRAFFDDVFSGAGGTTTRANLLALWKALATYAKKLFSTGTGSDASPATVAANLAESFVLTPLDVASARAS